MSKEIEKFVDEVMQNPQLIESIKSGTIGIKELVDFAKSKGFNFTEAEAVDYLKDSTVQNQLSQKAISGAAASSGVTQTNSVQTAETVTTEVAQVEVVQTGVAETTVFVAAEAVLFAT